MLKYYHYFIPNTKTQILDSISLTENRYWMRLNHESGDPGKSISIDLSTHCKKDDIRNGKIIPSKMIKISKQVIDERTKLQAK